MPPRSGRLVPAPVVHLKYTKDSCPPRGEVPSMTAKIIVPRLRAPIVLVHGLFGFDRLQMGPWVVANYFPGIPEALRAAGNRVLVARVSPTEGIASRAAQLKDFLDRESPHEPVHLFGHSMGGLDSRYLI